MKYEVVIAFIIRKFLDSWRKEKEWDNNQIESALCKFWIKFKRGLKMKKKSIDVL